MTSHRFLSIAVKLCLIVVLAIQPMATYAMPADCGADGFTCPGCGCCEVEEAQQRCGCCGGSADTLAESSPAGDCCSHDAAEDNTDANVSAALSGHRQASLTAAEETAQSLAITQPLLACSCQQQPQPLHHGPAPRTDGEPRPSIALGYVAFDATSLGDSPRSVHEIPCRAFVGLEHGSQVLFCIWRL